MTALRLTVSLIFPPTRGFSPESRKAVADARRSAAAEIRLALNDVRRRGRAAGPRRTGALRRSLRVRRERAIEPGAVTLSVTASPFYASFTNERGAARGWWDDAVGEIDHELVRIGRGVAERLASVFLRELARDFIRGVRQDLSGSRRVRGPGLAFYLVN